MTTRSCLHLHHPDKTYWQHWTLVTFGSPKPGPVSGIHQAFNDCVTCETKREVLANFFPNYKNKTRPGGKKNNTSVLDYSEDTKGASHS